MIIFGVLGDLMKCKLMLVLYLLYVVKCFLEEFEIFGVGCMVYEDVDYWIYIYNEMEKFVKLEEQNKEKMDVFVGYFYYLVIDLVLESGYGQFCLCIEELSGDSWLDDLLFYFVMFLLLYGVILLYLKLVYLNKGCV